MNVATLELVELLGIVIPEKATLEEMVRAGGYDYADESITSANFPITCRGPRKLYIVHFEKCMDTGKVEQAVAQMPDKKLAKVEDLLAVGAHPKHKELQREFAIFCLGSSAVLHGYRFVPCLSGHHGRRELHLARCYVHEWLDICRFLLVGTSSPGATAIHSK